MPAGKRTLPRAGLFVAAGLLLSSPNVYPENQFSFYTGSSFTRNSDLHVSQPGRGTDLSLRDVEWSADPFKAAPYYGLRLAHFYESTPNWGVALDYTHYKMYARTDRIVQASGMWKGAAVNAGAAMDRYVQHFEISHGVNVLSINAIHRWLSPALAGGRLQPYAGAGLAYYRPHSENTVDNSSHETGYEASGFGYQLLGGLHYQATPRIGAFIETKFNSGTARVGIADGQASTRLRTFHAIVGVSYGF